MLRLALAPGVAPGRDLPRVLFANQLEHLDKAAWLGLAAALVIKDRHATEQYPGVSSPADRLLEPLSHINNVWHACRHAREDGRNGFASPQLGDRFRAAAFAGHGLQQPDLAGSAPRAITLLTAVGGEEVMLMMEAPASCPTLLKALGGRTQN